MSEDIIRFDEHRRRRNEDDDLVPCARCGKMILATVLRCTECGVHFQGEAQEFVHASDHRTTTRPTWFITAAIVLVIIYIASALGIW